MKCPNCGYDKILPMYKFCPQCKQPLNASNEAKSQTNTEEGQPNTKLIGMLLMSYKKAIENPKGFGEFCVKHPNDSKRLWEKWEKEGRDLSPIEKYNPTRSNSTSTNTTSPSKKEEEKPSQQHQTAVESAQAAAATAANTPKVAVSDVVAVGSRNKEHNYVNWSIAPGQIARNISAQAFQELEKVDGVYVQEGVTAVIFVDGEQVAELQGGVYKFSTEKIQRDAAEKEEDDRSKEGLVKKIGRAGRSLWALITGNRDKYNKEEARKKRERVKKIAQKLSGNSVVAVVLKRDSAIQLTMGIRPVATEDGTSQMEFAPFKIRTKTLTVDVAVALEVRISNFYEFRTTYLMDQMSYSVNDVRMALNSWMRTAIQRQMQEYEADGQLIPSELMSSISYDIILQSRQLLHGIEVTQVLDITTENEAFERFRALEEKFYCTEKEIDYLARTNEFKNRLQSEENAQKLREARTELELRKELDSINNDQLVHEDEMEAFVQLLQSQKRIREARTENEELAALLELKGNRLVSEDEFDALESSIRDKKFDRDQVSEAFQLASVNRTENTRLQLENQLAKSRVLAEAELEDARFKALRKKTEQGFSLDDIAAEHRRAQEAKEAEHQSSMLDAELSEASRRDSYADSRRDSNYDFEQRQKQDAYQQNKQEAQDIIDFERQRAQNSVDIDKQKAQTEMDILRQKAEIARQNMEAMQRHEAELAEKKHQEEMANIAAKQNMSADQLMAAGMAGMSAEAQKAFAESFAGKNASEQQKEMYERMMQMQQQHAGESSAQNAAQMAQMQAMMQQMMQFAQSGMQTNAQMAANMAAGQQAGQQAQLNAMQNIAAGRQAEVNAMKDEYRQQMQHEQGRVDRTQDAALNYTTKVTQSSNVNPATKSEDKKYYLPDFGQAYSRQEIENYIMQGVVNPNTEIDANGINGKVYEQEEFFSFCLQKYGIPCPQCGKKYLTELGVCTECGYEE